MVAIKTRDAERFVKEPPEAVFLFLVYGPDAGLVRERALRLAERRVGDRRDPFQCVELSGDAVAADPLLLLDEANTVPLFGGRRAILVDAGSKSIAPAIERLLAAPPKECSVIVAAGDLKRDAPLRKLAEGAKGAAAIACYPDAEQDLDALIGATLREAGLSITPEARALLHSALGEDRLMSRAELAKLTLYAHGEKAIDVGDVESVVAHAANAANRVTFDAFSGQAGAGLEDALTAGGDGAQLIGAALRYALALHRARLAVEREGRLEAGLGVLKRTGFGFGHAALLQEHLRLWTAEKLEELFDPLRAAWLRARANARIASMEAARAHLRIAAMAGRRSARA